MGSAAYGAFVGVLAFPWIFKFLIGPFVDNLHLKRFGARKQWIMTAQVGMFLAFVLAMLNMPDRLEIETDEGVGPIATWKYILTSHIGLFALLLLIHNTLAATQDVAIDALACRILKPDERGLANGIMFGSYRLGELTGGSTILWLTHRTGNFQQASVLVLVLMACIIPMVFFFVREKSAAQQMSDGELPAPPPGVSGFQQIRSQLKDYNRTVFKSILCTWNGFFGVLLSLTPIGALALSMLLSSLIAPRIGMDRQEVAYLGYASTFVFLVFCPLGGWISDRFGRRLTLAISASLTIIPSLWMATQFKEAGFAHPQDASAEGTWPRQEELIMAWWVATLSFTVFNSFAHGVKNALYMDIVNPKIAATQFTMFAAFTNLTNIYSKFWQSQAIDTDGWAWPLWNLLYIDAAIGLVFLVVLYLIRPEKAKNDMPAST
ncbi:MAG: MFS transporter [Akkermansiaceae bacterium]|nr:MFS transporter [Akkermansiaceae bacterium]